MSDRRRISATVHGRVQGVGFRWFVRAAAARLGLVGWVANDPSGSVSVVVEGEQPELDVLLADLRHGPPGAAVDRVETTESPPTGEFNDFRIRSAGHAGD